MNKFPYTFLWSCKQTLSMLSGDTHGSVYVNFFNVPQTTLRAYMGCVGENMVTLDTKVLAARAVAL